MNIMTDKLVLKNILVAVLIIAATMSFLNLLISPASAALPLEELDAMKKITETNFKLPSLLILGCLAVLLMIIPRRYIILVYVLLIILVPQDQRYIISGISFTALRILTLLGVARLVMAGFIWNKFDTLVISVALVTSFVYILLHKETGAALQRCGVLLDTVGIYCIFRQSIRNWSDVKFLITALGIGILVMVPFVFNESRTGVNPFSALSSAAITAERDEKLRCQGSFVHPIVLGTFWALAMPLFYGMFRISRNKIFYAAALCAALFIIFATNSSTPISTLVVVALLVFLFSKRHHTKTAIKVFFILLVIMHFACLAIKGKPIWWLLTKVNFISASTSWYRYYLFDCFIKDFKGWFLLGTADTGLWDPNRLTWDVTNQYIFVGVTGGIWGLILFLVLIGLAVKTLIVYYQKAASQAEQFLTWCVAVSFVSFLIAFFGIELYGQLNFLWYLLLAVVAFIYGEKRSKTKEAING